MQPLYEVPQHFFNATKYGLEEWFQEFNILDIEVSEQFHVGYSLSWLVSELMSALGAARESLQNLTLWGDC